MVIGKNLMEIIFFLLLLLLNNVLITKAITIGAGEL
jgi:hypothetical protein